MHVQYVNVLLVCVYPHVHVCHVCVCVCVRVHACVFCVHVQYSKIIHAFKVAALWLSVSSAMPSSVTCWNMRTSQYMYICKLSDTCDPCCNYISALSYVCKNQKKLFLYILER